MHISYKGTLDFDSTKKHEIIKLGQTQEHKYKISLVDSRWCDFFQVLHSPFLQKLQNRTGL